MPESILNRQKEQFGGGVGYIDGLRDHAEAKVSDGEMERAAIRFQPPATKEAYFYARCLRSISRRPPPRTVPEARASRAKEKALEWDERLQRTIDPSGRAVDGIHNDAY